MRLPIGLELAPLDSQDVEMMRRWRNDFRVWRWARQNDFITDLQQKDWYEKKIKDPATRFYKLALTTNDKITPVGVCTLSDIDWQNRRAEFSIYIDPSQHRKGLGREAMRILLMHAFQNLGLQQVWGETFAGNPALKLFESLGFKKDGLRRQFYFKDGAYHDSHMVSILHSEWLSSQRPVSEPRSDSIEYRGGDSGEPERPSPTPPPPKSVAGATSQTRIRRGPQKDAGGKPRRSVSLVERAGITTPGEPGKTIDI